MYKLFFIADNSLVPDLLYSLVHWIC